MKCEEFLGLTYCLKMERLEFTDAFHYLPNM